MGKKVICLDPGHGPGCVNGSPDGSYKEYEFAWDMAQRLKKLLEGQGIRVVLTKEEGEYPSLTERVAVGNGANATLLISLHSNAFGSGWTAPQGLLIYTSAGGNAAGRNLAAKAILARMKEGGVALHSAALQHSALTVLVKANAPAVLIEYGFHTNRADTALLKDSTHRQTLALATARGVCDYLGIPWREEGGNHREIVQNRFSFSDSTMDYLEAYAYADALLERLAAGTKL